MKKRLLSIAMALVMCLSLLPAPALAADTETTLAAGETTTINDITFTAGTDGATVVQAEDGDVADDPFVVLTSGEISATLEDGQSVTVAYPGENGGYTNAETIEAGTDDVSVALTLRAEGENSVTLNHMEAVTISDVSYAYNNSMGSAYITFAFKEGDVSVIDHNQGENSGQLTISAANGTTDVLRGVDFPTDTGEVVLQVKNASTSSEPDIIFYFISGAISMGSGDAPAIKIGSAATVSPDENGSINVVITKSEGITSVDGSALITTNAGSYTIEGDPGQEPGIGEGILSASKLLISGGNVTMEYGIVEQVSGNPVITLPTIDEAVNEESITPRITLNSGNAFTFAGYSDPLILESLGETTIEDYVGDVKHALSDSQLWINCENNNTCTLNEWGEGGIQCLIPTGSEACINGNLYVWSNDADNDDDDDTISVTMDAEENDLVTIDGPAAFTYNKYDPEAEGCFLSGNQPAVTVAKDGTVSLKHGTMSIDNDLIALGITLNDDAIILTNGASICYADESFSLDSGWALNLDSLVYSDDEVTITPHDINASYSYGKPGGSTGMLTLSEGSVRAALNNIGDSFIYHEAATGTDGINEFVTASDTTFKAGEPNASVVFTIEDDAHSFMTGMPATHADDVCTIGSSTEITLDTETTTHTSNDITYTLATEDEDAYIRMNVGTSTTNIIDLEVTPEKTAVLTVDGSVDLMRNGTLEYKVDESAEFTFTGHEDSSPAVALTDGCVDLVGEEAVQILGSCTYGISGPAAVTITGEDSAAVQANDGAILWTIDEEGGLDTNTYLASISGNANFTLSVDEDYCLTIDGPVTLTHEGGIGTYADGDTSYTVTEISIEEGFAVTITKADREISSEDSMRVENVDEENGTCTLALSCDIYVGGVGMMVGEYLASGADSVSETRPESGGYAYYESADKLILNNYEYDGEGYIYDGGDGYDYTYSAAIYPANGDLTIELAGSSSIANIQYLGEGIFSESTVTIGGSGSLDITADYSGINAHGIVIQSGTITVDATGDDADAIVSYDGGDVTINGGTITVEAYGDYASGIATYDADVIINGGTITIEAGYSSNGIYTDDEGNVDFEKGTLNISAYDGIDVAGKLTVRGGTITIESEDDGFEALQGIEIRDGDITITSTGGSGLEACGDVAILGGTLRITSVDEAIYIEPDDNVGGGSVTISGGTVTIETQSDGIDVNRIYDEYGELIGDGNITLSGGTLDITAASEGLEANGNISITGGSLTIMDGTDETGNLALWAGGEITLGSKITMQEPQNGSVQRNDDYSTIVDSNGAVVSSVKLVSSGGSSGGSSSGGSTSSGGGSTTTEKNDDGSTTTTTTDKATGTVTETTKTTSGVTGTTVTDKNGNVTSIEATIPASAANEAKKNGEAVTIPVTVSVTNSSSTAPSVSINVPNAGAKVEIPVDNATTGTVAVIVNPDGTVKIVKQSLATEDGVVLTLEKDATVKVIDNSTDFADVAPNSTFESAIDFMSARELMNGVGDGSIFNGNAPATRAMVWTILGRGVDADLYGAGVFTKAQDWAVKNGVSDGSNPNDTITRQQLAVMLWRQAGQPVSSHDISRFADTNGIADYANVAMRWAVENGILSGNNGNLNPGGAATRNHIAAMYMRWADAMN